MQTNLSEAQLPLFIVPRDESLGTQTSGMHSQVGIAIVTIKRRHCSVFTLSL
jgi:hypothetical protein